MKITDSIMWRMIGAKSRIKTRKNGLAWLEWDICSSGCITRWEDDKWSCYLTMYLNGEQKHSNRQKMYRAQRHCLSNCPKNCTRTLLICVKLDPEGTEEWEVINFCMFSMFRRRHLKCVADLHENTIWIWVQDCSCCRVGARGANQRRE